MTRKLLGELERDSAERLKWLVCRRLGIMPGSALWHMMTRRRALRYACHMVLDGRGSPDSAGDGFGESGSGSGFDEARFRRMKEAGL